MHTFSHSHAVGYCGCRNNNNNDSIYRALNLVKNDNSKCATHTTHTCAHGVGMYNYVQKAGERVRVRIKNPVAEFDKFSSFKKSWVSSA